MNDPHVDQLHYKIRHGQHVDYAKAAPLEIEQPDFALYIADGQAKISLKSHFASVQTARKAVEPFLKAWELHVDLLYGPGSLELVYERPVMIDRKPTPGETVIYAEAGCIALSVGSVTVCVGFATFPAPREGMARDGIVEEMFANFVRYREGRSGITTAANYCLTALEKGAGSRRGKRTVAAKRYSVSEEVLGKIGDLTSNKGGA